MIKKINYCVVIVVRKKMDNDKFDEVILLSDMNVLKDEFMN